MATNLQANQFVDLVHVNVIPFVDSFYVLEEYSVLGNHVTEGFVFDKNRLGLWKSVRNSRVLVKKPYYLFTN